MEQEKVEELIVKADTFIGVMQYLSTRPYTEVNNLIKALERSKPVPVSKEESKKEVKVVDKKGK